MAIIVKAIAVKFNVAPHANPKLKGCKWVHEKIKFSDILYSPLVIQDLPIDHRAVSAINIQSTIYILIFYNEIQSFNTNLPLSSQPVLFTYKLTQEGW